MSQRKMHLMAYLKTGPSAMQSGAWRHPAADLHDIFEPRRYEHLARVLEAACFDGCFFADTLGISDIHGGSFAPYLRHGGQISYLDPVMVLPIMARATRHLGLGATLSTTFHHPYHLARMLASLDLLSAGRACWNVVTSTTAFEARNFGMSALPAKEDRYDRGDEVVEACCALWECWDADALVMDKASGVFADPAKVRYADYAGRHVSTRGPLAMPRSPQGRPVLMQAGSSPRGRAFAARWAEVIFCSLTGIAACVAFHDDIMSRMAAHGREPNDCAVLPWITVVVGETEAIAREKAEYLASLASPELTRATNSAMLGADLARVRSADELTGARGEHGHGGLADHLTDTMAAKNLSLEQATERADSMVVGTPAMIADQMEAVFTAGGCDGFVVMPVVSPATFEEFGRFVVPELQRRGLFRTAYTGATMRENLKM